jgi:hypothetical protein
MEKGEYL